MLGQMLRKNFRARRKHHRLTNAQQQPQREQRHKAHRRARKHRRQRPCQKSQRHHSVRAPAIDKQPHHKLQRRISPEKGRKQHSKLRCSRSPLQFEQRRRQCQVAAINVVNQNRQNQQHQCRQKYPQGRPIAVDNIRREESHRSAVYRSKAAICDQKFQLCTANSIA